MPYQAREVAFKLGLEGKQINQFVKLMSGAYQTFVDNDFALLEINPLAVRENGEIVLCWWQNQFIDSNALYRLPKIAALQDKTQENERELKAAGDWYLKFGVSYGLAMATMDIIKLYGGKPANFLDVGGGATRSRCWSVQNHSRSSSVEGVLINIFGGIVRCDAVAEAIIEAVKEVNVKVPVVVRLEGNNAEKGARSY